VRRNGSLEKSLLGSLLENPGVQNSASVDSNSDENLLKRLNWWAEIVESVSYAHYCIFAQEKKL